MDMFLTVDWDAVGAIASAVATIAALVTIILSIKSGKDSDVEKQYGVQPWFHVTSVSRMGVNAPVKLIVLNDAASTIRIDKINFIVEHESFESKFRYLKKDDPYTVTGKTFEVEVMNNDSFFGKHGHLEIYFTNLYNNKMKSVSPNFLFEEKQGESSLLFIESKDFLYIPFKNELI